MTASSVSSTSGKDAACITDEPWKTMARPPWDTAFWDRVSLLNPIVWWRIAVFKRVDWTPLVYSAAAVALPVCGGLFWFRETSTAADRRRIFQMYLTSPWTLAWTWKAAVTANKLLSATLELLRAQSTTRSEAYKCLAQRIQQGRAYRERGYDVYLPASSREPWRPPSPQHPQPPECTMRCILFLTGATVEHTAYAPVAAMLSDIVVTTATSSASYLVVVVSAEPLRMVDVSLPRFSPAALRMLQRTIEQRHCRRRPHGPRDNLCKQDAESTWTQDAEYPWTTVQIEWILMGHSMGSFACTKLAPLLRSVKAVVMWGAAPFVDFMGDLSNTNTPLLVVQASQDAVMQAFATPELTRRFWQLLPASTVRHEISGGTHSGFGNYIPCWKPEVDGIDVTSQQRKAVDLTVSFLNGLD